MHLAVVSHYLTGTTTNSASLVLKRVRIRSSVEDGYFPPIIQLDLPPCRGNGLKRRCLCKVFSGKLLFYCVNTSYPMDNCFTGRRDRSRQTPEKDVLYRIPTGPVRRVHLPGGASYFIFLSRHRDVIASFSFGAWRVKTCFQRQGNFWFYTELIRFISYLK